MRGMFTVHAALCTAVLLTGCAKPAATATSSTSTQSQAQIQPQVQKNGVALPDQRQLGPKIDRKSGLPTIARQQLPAEGQQTLRLIEQGGPFPYPKDGVVFGNYEGVLPRQARGYYHEYTVPTPGAKTRATRRIVCGTPANSMGPECYYTGDHYATFSRINP